MPIADYLRRNALITGIVVLGFYLRIRNILTYEFWFDESFTSEISRAPLNEFIKTISNESHPPLYSIFNRVWVELFGYSDLSLRMPALVFGTLTIIAVYFLGKKYFSRNAGLGAALLTALNPFLIGYSQEARSYSFFGLVIVLAVWAALSRKWLLTCLLMSVAMLTHYMAVLFVMPISVFLIAENIKAGPKKLLRLILILLPFFVITTLTLNRGYKISSKNLNLVWVEKPSAKNVPISLASYTLGVKVKKTGANEINDLKLPINKLIIGKTVLFTTLLLITAFVSFKAGREERKNVLFLASLIFIPQILLIALSFYTLNIMGRGSLYVERYIFPSGVLFSACLGICIGRLGEIKGLLLAGAFFAASFLLIKTPDYYTGMRQVADELKTSEADIAFSSPIDYLNAKHYFKNRNHLKIYDPANPTETFSHWPFVQNQIPSKEKPFFLVSPNEYDENEFQLEKSYEIESYKIYLVGKRD